MAPARQLAKLGADAAGIVLGARVPNHSDVAPDNLRTHMRSCAVAMLRKSLASRIRAPGDEVQPPTCRNPNQHHEAISWAPSVGRGHGQRLDCRS
jgi:hypothetical protein